jgi:hypothetical protein
MYSKFPHFIWQLDTKAEKEAAEFDAAREKHDKALLAWATNNKEKRNVRTLLSTMHVSRILPDLTVNSVLMHHCPSRLYCRLATNGKRLV